MEATALLIVILLPFLFRQYQITSPFGYIAFFLGLFFILKFAHHEWLGATFLEGLPSDYISEAFIPMIVYLGGAYAVAITLNWAINTRAAKLASVDENVNHVRPTRLASILLIILPTALVGAGLAQGINPVENPLLFRQLIQGKGMFYVLSLLLFLLATHAVYLPYCVIAKKELPSALSVVAYVVALTFALVSGFASMLVSFVVSPLFFASICYRKRIEPYIIFGIPIAFIYALIYSAYRDARFSDNAINLVEAAEKVFSNPEITAFAFNRFDYLEMFAKGWHYASAQLPDYGLSILSIFAQPIPRSLWEDKPDGFSTLMTKALLPQNFDIGVTANFNSLNEFIYSFGYMGLIVGSIVFGLILLFAYRTFLFAAFKPYQSLFYLLVIFPYVTGGFMSGFINDLPLPVLILNWIYFRLFVRKQAIKPAAANGRYMHFSSSARQNILKPI